MTYCHEVSGTSRLSRVLLINRRRTARPLIGREMPLNNTPDRIFLEQVNDQAHISGWSAVIGSGLLAAAWVVNLLV